MAARPHLLLTVVLTALAAHCRAEDAYYGIPVQKLTITERTMPQGINVLHHHWWLMQALWPYAVLDNGGECYVYIPSMSEPWRRPSGQDGYLHIRCPAADEITGTLFVPGQDGAGMQRLRFKVATGPFTTERVRFLDGKRAYYVALQRRRIAGAAWFRHQVNLINRELGDQPLPSDTAEWRWQNEDELAQTFALFTGGRAVSENLQLDRALPPATQPATEEVPLDTLAGITVQEMNWTELTKDLRPQLDPLAAMIPADQHAIFFPSFEAMQQLLDRANEHGSVALLTAEQRSEDALTQDYYQRQLCLPVSALSRALGPVLVKSTAFTGSDPYLRVGSDVAVLFEAASPQTLAQLLKARVSLALQSDRTAKPVDGRIDDVAWSGAVSSDRSICSYQATLGNVVVVTNSLTQLKRIVAVHKGQSPALAGLPEYVFFRDRYKRGDASETALLILSDATIRRWCGPRWRIADSRRTRAAAVLSDLQAQHVQELATRTAVEKPLASDRDVPHLGQLRLTPSGVASSVYGSLEFMTPIAELEFDKVTKAEASSYDLWRDSYQRNWRWFFDPIACRFSIGEQAIGVDLTVMPLIASTEYRQFVQLTEGSAIAHGAGDPHDAIAHLVLGINPDSPTLKSWGRTMQNLTGDLRIEPLAWLGSCVAIYADDDPFWAELAAADDVEEFFEKNYQRMPLALYAESRDAFRLAAFLTMIRAYVEQSAPELTRWETLRHGQQSYVKVTAREDHGPDGQSISVYYAAMPKALVVSFNEDVVKRAINRQLAPSSQPTTTPSSPWLGSNMCLLLKQQALKVLDAATRKDSLAQAQLVAWSNIPILNEWRRMFPDRDPVEVHRQLWHVRLIDPGGGTYTWNEQWHTMQSSMYGHPGEPKTGPSLLTMLQRFSANFGLTFENKGLRAKAEVEETQISK